MTDLPFALDTLTQKRLGLIVLQTDETIEQDFRKLLPPEVSLHVSRIPSGTEVTHDTLKGMEAHLTASAGLFPRAVEFDAAGYACTSAASVIGPARVAELVASGTRTKAVTDPVTSLVAACCALGLSRIALLSPYVAEVSDRLRHVLAENDIETPAFGSFNIADDATVVRISGVSIKDAAVRLVDQQKVDAIFLSCTNLRTLDLIEELEAAIGKPVLSSNQVLAWHMCRLADAGDLPGWAGALVGAQ